MDNNYDGMIIDLESSLESYKLKEHDGTIESAGLNILEIKKKQYQIEAYKKARAFDILYSKFDKGDKDLSKADFDEALLK